MKHPWQIWLVYLLILAAVLPGLGWLTHQALELDRTELQARAQAELDENVGLALWRMDTKLTLLLGPEAARPYFVYRPYYTPPGLDPKTGQPRRVASPLLTSPSEFVLLNFQLQPDGTLISPQCPEPAANSWALENGATTSSVVACAERRDVLAGALDHDQLLARLPQETLPPIDIGLNTSNYKGADNLLASEQQPAVVNDASKKMKQQLDNVQQRELQDSPQQGQGGANPNEPPQQTVFFNDYAQRAQSKIRRDVDSYDNRTQVLQNFAQSQRLNQAGNSSNLPPPLLPSQVSEGVSRPLWVGDNLLLARKTTIGKDVVVQGCWLDWPKLRDMLRREVSAFLPEVDFQAVTDESPITPGRVLATLPVQLVVAPAVADTTELTPIRFSLIIAWSCLVLAAAVVAFLLAGVVRLSERRAAFVSSVTHELRTPLTTFRMYTEMLADDMVPSEEARKSYLRTLRSEAERLSHLVANVLAYARLERGRRTSRTDVSLGDLLERVRPRLAERAQQAGLELDVTIDAAARGATVSTDPAAAEQILFNLVDNAAKYAAVGPDKRLHVTATLASRSVELRVRDHGAGMPQKSAWRQFRPFSKTSEEAAHSAPGVGLGLALCRRLARDLGGSLALEHTCAEGTTFLLKLPRA